MWSWFKRILFTLFLLLLLLIGWKVSKKFINKANKKKEINQEGEKKYLKIFGLDKVPEFQKDPNLIKKWDKEGSFSYQEIRDWLSIGLKPNEYEFAWWIVSVRSKKFPNSQDKINNKEPLWLKDNVNIEELRKEYLEK